MFVTHTHKNDQKSLLIPETTHTLSMPKGCERRAGNRIHQIIILSPCSLCTLQEGAVRKGELFLSCSERGQQCYPLSFMLPQRPYETVWLQVNVAQTFGDSAKSLKPPIHSNSGNLLNPHDVIILTPGHSLCVADTAESDIIWPHKILHHELNNSSIALQTFSSHATFKLRALNWCTILWLRFGACSHL